MADPDGDDLIDDWEHELLDNSDEPAPEPVKAAPLTVEAVTELKAKMATSKDLDPSLARPARAVPGSLREVSFEIFDRQAMTFRVISRAFTESSLLILAKVCLDELAGVRTPYSATEVHQFLTRSNGAVSPDAFTCGYGTVHTPMDDRFLVSLDKCKSDAKADQYDATDPWCHDHRPWMAYGLSYGAQNGMWYYIDPTYEGGDGLPVQAY